jgi:sialidase-1
MKTLVATAFSFLRLGLLSCAGAACLGAAPLCKETRVWKYREDGMASYFVYGLTLTKKGTILACSEARIGSADQHPHHLAVKRSTDGGATWSENIFVEYADTTYWSTHGRPGRLECWANGALLTERETGRIFYFYLLSEGDIGGKNTQRFSNNFYRYSDDDGLTWSARHDLGDVLNVKADGSPNQDADGKWIPDVNGFPSDYMGRGLHVPGPGHGVQLKSGRLMMQFWNRTALGTNDGVTIPFAQRLYGQSTIYSDDRGRTWKAGPMFGREISGNETRMLELDNGDIYVNVRADNSRDGRRAIFIGKDNGARFELRGYDDAMPRFFAADGGLTDTRKDGRQVIVFSHPRNQEYRGDMTISASLDGGKTWAVHKPLGEPIKSGSMYSDMVTLPDGTLGVIYGKGAVNRNEVMFARFNLEWLGL